MESYEFWRERQTGETWAVKFIDGVVVGSCGPLDHSEVDEQFLEGLYYSPERAAWIEEHRDAFDLSEFLHA